MSDVTTPQPQTEETPRRDGGSPMNLTCTGPGFSAEGTPSTVYIILTAPGAPPPNIPDNAEILVPTESTVTYTLTGTGPNGNTIPGRGMNVPGTGITVYKVPT